MNICRKPLLATPKLWLSCRSSRKNPVLIQTSGIGRPSSVATGVLFPGGLGLHPRKPRLKWIHSSGHLDETSGRQMLTTRYPDVLGDLVPYLHTQTSPSVLGSLGLSVFSPLVPGMVPSDHCRLRARVGDSASQSWSCGG